MTRIPENRAPSAPEPNPGLKKEASKITPLFSRAVHQAQSPQAHTWKQGLPNAKLTNVWKKVA